jgi:hemerythrin-like domain-containing protein
MATRKKSAARTSRGRKAAGTRKKSGSQDALALLKADHETVSELVEKYERGKERMDGDRKSALAQKICQELQVHSQIEEEIFYPAVREHCDGADDLLAEAEVEHGSIKELIEKVESEAVDDELYDAHVKVIGEYVKHHVKEEQNKIFPMARKADLDLKELGRQLMERKHELKGEEGKGKSRTMRRRRERESAHSHT